jgi:hypothetical protein
VKILKIFRQNFETTKLGENKRKNLVGIGIVYNDGARLSLDMTSPTTTGKYQFCTRLKLTLKKCVRFSLSNQKTSTTKIAIHTNLFARKEI